MLRDKIYQEIIQTIDSHGRFESSDFNIETKKINTGVRLTITYLIDSKYYIIIDIPSAANANSYNYTISAKVCPGPLAFEEQLSLSSKNDILNNIKTWLDCIWEELLTNPFIKKMESQQSQIDEILKNYDNISDTYFTLEEANELKIRLDKLEGDLKAEIQKNTQEKRGQEIEINKLHKDIETLKETLHSFKKKGWLKSFTSKVVKWSMNSDNRKLLGDGYKVVRELLPPDVKANLP